MDLKNILINSSKSNLFCKSLKASTELFVNNINVEETLNYLQQEIDGLTPSGNPWVNNTDEAANKIDTDYFDRYLEKEIEEDIFYE